MADEVDRSKLLADLAAEAVLARLKDWQRRGCPPSERPGIVEMMTSATGMTEAELFAFVQAAERAADQAVGEA